MIKPTLIVLLLASPAMAQDEPSEAHKAWALRRAYELNGNSMVRAPHLGSIDLSRERPPVVVDPNEVNALDAAALPASTRSRRKDK